MGRPKETRRVPAEVAPPQRVGARRMSEIPPDVLVRLSNGEIQTASLVEILAIDFGTLVGKVLREVGLRAGPADLERVRAAGEFLDRFRAGAACLEETAGKVHRAKLVQALAVHTSDAARGMGALVVAADPTLSLKGLFKGIRPFADDSHSGVREWAWMAVRPRIAAELVGAIGVLAEWSLSSSENVRRFASEATRPRGVWCAHIQELKERPEVGLPVLEPLRADPTKYVQDSVGNWLNDASKSQPEWVREVCGRWMKESSGAATARIVKRALRTIGEDAPVRKPPKRARK